MNSLPTVGFALCGSFCTLDKAIEQMEMLKEQEYNILPIMSKITYETDTRFGKARDIREKIEDICQNKIIHEITKAEPIGPKKLLDILVIAPCTGNTLGKLANGITDTAVTMAAKAQLRNSRPVLIAPSTNDGLTASAKNIGLLMNNKNIYFVPYEQDDPVNKCNSVVAIFELLPKAISATLEGKQMQPILR